MITWPHFPSRTTHDLDGLWDAAWLGEDADVDALDMSSLDFTEKLPVPGCFDTDPAFVGRRGTMAYRTLARITPGARSRLRFGGIGLWARVYIDGHELHTCDLPYSGFAVDVPPSDRDERELVVVIDNRLDDERVSLFQQWYDFYGYGGIYRSVSWTETPAVWIDRVQVTTTDVAAGKIDACVVLGGDVPDSVAVTTYFDDGEAVDHGSRAVSGGEIRLSLDVPDPRPWSPADPNLHVLVVTCGDDSIAERFGLRVVRTEGQKVLLNDEPVKLLGFCRHEAHPQFGPALPLGQMVQDLQLLKDMGCNFIRGSHYPQSQLFLDVCDEMGFLVWEETLGWGHGAAQWERPAFLDANLRQARAMVRNSYNHPSVIMWGVLNEGGSHLDETRPVYEGLAKAIREEDTSRPFTYATNRLFEKAGDKHLDLVDIVAVNTYPGWYERGGKSTRPLDEIIPFLREHIDDLDDLGCGDKPLIISEIGAGAIRGWRDAHKAHWTEDYQADFLRVVCSEIVENERYAGISIWQFCDARTFDTSQALGRPRAFNNKGIVDEYRRPKLAYDVVKQIFGGGTTA